MSSRSLQNFWNFPRYTNHRCTGRATMSNEHGNDRLITAHAPSCYYENHQTVPVSTATTVSKILANSPTIFCFLRLPKKINPHNLQLSNSRCGSIVRKTNWSYSAIASKKVTDGACTVISQSFPRSVDIVGWPVQRWFAYRGKFHKLCKDRGEIIMLCKLKLVFPTGFPRNQK